MLKYKPILLLSFLALSGQRMSAQGPVEVSDGVNKLIELIGDAKAVYRFAKLDTPIALARNAISLARGLNDARGECVAMVTLSELFRFLKPDSSVILANNALTLARKSNYPYGECRALIAVGEERRLGGDFPQSLEALFEALQISRNLSDRNLETRSLTFIGIAYVDLGEYRQGLNYLLRSKMLNEKLLSAGPDTSLTIMHSFGLSNAGSAYEELNILDSALIFENWALKLMPPSKYTVASPLEANITRRLGNIYRKLGDYEKALDYYRHVIRSNDLLNVSNAHYHVAEYFFDIKKNVDSSLYYALFAYRTSQDSKQKASLLDATTLLAKIYKAKDKPDSSIYYYEMSMTLKDSLFGPDKVHKLQVVAINEQQRQQQIMQEQQAFKSRFRTYVLLGIVTVFLLLAIIFYRNTRQKQKANKILEDTLKNLRSTQSQLIQSEKMASLGELTAGIAHEIQNPLNFINNFSDVNTELIDELEGERSKAKDERDEQLESNIVRDIKANEEKINHHGKRADAIVKSMLQHSRTSTGQKELTDINALTDEYLRLAYHGLRAKDKSFNAKFITDFTDTAGKINIIPQEIGRVILNLINNAFYAVHEKQKHASTSSAQSGYEPTVTVTTARDNGSVKIKVKDNGNGISQKNLDKIFQPFFTTKPTGQGTGLGLSLAYEIVKAHGGEIRMETKENEGSNFIIQLPDR